MKDEIRKFLWDVREACREIDIYLRGKDKSDYLGDSLLRAGAERQLMIVGEALYQARKIAPELSDSVTDLRKIISFRHLLVHDYSSTENETVWGILGSKVPLLREEVERLLDDENGE